MNGLFTYIIEILTSIQEHAYYCLLRMFRHRICSGFVNKAFQAHP